nr:sporulation-delaying protein SdpB family protein [Macrococcus equipercicus]
MVCDNLIIPTSFCLAQNYSWNLEIMRFVMIIILIISMLGFAPFITCIFHWYICYSIQNNGLPIDGGDQIATVISFLLIPILLTDWRINQYNIPIKPLDYYKKLISFSFFWIIKIQICIIYFSAAIGRLKNEEWGNGTALYYFFKDSIFGVPDWEYKLLTPILESKIIIPITWGITILEVFLAFNIIGSPKTKKIALLLGIFLHLGIGLTIGIWSFSIVMIVCLFLYLYPFEIHDNKEENV